MLDIPIFINSFSNILAGSVLRMFQQMVGDVVFREALHVYLARK